MSQEIPTTDVFETHLENGRSAILDARQTYSAVELNEKIPDTIVEAIGNLEQEFNDLDQTLDVTKEDVQLARQAENRATILASVFNAFQLYQEMVVKADLRRLEVYESALGELRDEINCPDPIESQFTELDRQLSMLEKLGRSGRHGKMVVSDRVSLGTVENRLRKIEEKLSTESPPGSRQQVYLAACNKLLDEIHETLLNLHDANKAKTAFSSDLRRVKELIKEAEAVEGNVEQGAKNARVALEGVFMLHHTICREGANQRVAEEFTKAVPAEKLGCHVEDAVSKGDVDTVLDAIGDFVGTQANRSETERLSQLLNEHDGSVARTIESTDHDLEKIIEQLEPLYEQQYISDIQVVFNS